ncbi:unnamed protein product [Trichobilharzia regenti]|nr:unnamed protein product [Trichobilharzia regenti]
MISNLLSQQEKLHRITNYVPVAKLDNVGVVVFSEVIGLVGKLRIQVFIESAFYEDNKKLSKSTIQPTEGNSINNSILRALK